MSPTSVAVLGTGRMGTPMARNLARAGMGVRVWNRTLDKAHALAGEGLTAAATPAEAVAGADVVLTMLFDADSVADAMAGPSGGMAGLKSGALWLQMSTVGVEGEQQLAALAAEHPVVYVDAPVLGTRVPAEQGALVVLASGPVSARAKCEQIFAPLSCRVMWVGGAGSGSRLKMVANSWVLALTAAMGEAVALAEGLGLDPQVFLDLIKNGATDSPYARLKADAMLRRDFGTSFTVSGALKDSRLVGDAMARSGVSARVNGAVIDHFAEADRLGHGSDDMAAVYYAAVSESGITR